MRGVVTALLEELALADCTRRKVAAVIVKDGVIIARGHNGLQSGSCLDGHCPRGQLSYDQQPKDVGYAESGCTASHAEVMALGRAGARAEGSILFTTEVPCPGCQDVIVGFQVGLVRILRVQNMGKFKAPV
jgi:dCMP deaminase